MNMFISFNSIMIAMAEMLIFALAGFLLLRFKIVQIEGFEVVSKIIIYCSLPLFIFHKLVTGFDFRLYSNWWIFPLMSFAVTGIGCLVAFLMIKVFKVSHRREFMSLLAFQNGGYLPLALVSALLPVSQAQVMFIYIFLFLLGFNILIWSFGMCMLQPACDIRDKQNFKKLFSAPVVATLASLILVFLGWNKFIPEAVLKPIKSMGDTTIPLALIVLGANVAQLDWRKAFNRESLLVVMGKLFIMPALALLTIFLIPMPKLIGLLFVLEMSVPSATSLAVISRRYNLEDSLISNTVMLTHLACIITLPLFLSIYELIVLS